MIKNKEHAITFLLCILLPTTLHGMRNLSKTSQTKNIRPITTTTTKTSRVNVTIPKTKTPVTQQISPTKTQRSPTRRSSDSSAPSFTPSFTSPKAMLSIYEGRIENAKKYQLPTEQYEKLIDTINEKEDFTDEEATQLALEFNRLQSTTELKKLTIQLNDLINTAQKHGIPNQELDIFKLAAQTDIDAISELGLDTLEIFIETLETNINQLEALIKEHASIKEKKEPITQKTPEEITEEQRIKELLEAFDEETEQEKITRETREAQEKTQKIAPRKIRLPKEIKESPLKEFMEKEQLRQAQEVAEKKAAEELTRLETEKLQKEVDQLYKEIEKEFTEELQTEQMRIDTQAHIKYIEQEQAKAAANKEDQQKLIDEITQSKAELEQIEREHQDRKTAIEQLQKEWEDKQEALDLQTQKETEASAAQQKIESAQRRKELEKAEAASLQAKKEALQAEQKAQEEQQKLDNAIIKTQQAQSALQAKEKSLADDAQAIKKLETELAQLQNKHQSTLQAMNQAKSQFTAQKQNIESQAQTELEQLNQEAATKLQQAKENLQKSQDFIAKTAEEQMAELDVLEKKYKEEATIKQQDIQTARDQQFKRINEKYEQELRMIETELNQFIEQQIKTEQKQNEERKKEKEEKERQEREREQQEKDKKAEGDGTIPQKTDIVQIEQTTTEEPRKQDNRQDKPNIPIIPPKEISTIQETEESTLLPIIPEITPIQPDKESQYMIEKPVYQAAETPTYPPFEQPSYYPINRATGTTPRWTTPTFSSYSPGSTSAPLIPSTSSASSTPSSAESIGWTSSDYMNPYTQRIELQPRFTSKDATTTPETEKDKKVQAQDIIWWEKLVPKWIVQYLGRKDRNLQETPKTESPAPIDTPETEKSVTQETGIVKTIVETIKKPISNAISYIRGLFNPS